MTLGRPAGLSSNKSAPKAPAKCQKCLESGHWTYECKGKRKFLSRASRTTLLNKRLKQMEDGGKGDDGDPSRKKTGSEKNDSSDDSSSSSSSSSSDSSSSSSDSSSDSSDSE
ncbi:unnamed protein product [Nesidiocoris tenuis]|uniref:Uncharacterized protein n=2 Tax=Nesidiocoris tenuis TaxID=355587 RepID=A0A6H5GJY7_9HEMI|nr:zinc finger, CHypothetical proteinC domain containing 10 [Nesidiocoris tenuis]CAB0002251.1 unnamed protein product [Nesidiocoris tenuis]